MTVYGMRLNGLDGIAIYKTSPHLITTPGSSVVSPGRYSPQSPTSIGSRSHDCSNFVGNLPPRISESRIHGH